jgi:hypothetical protein
MDLLYKLSPWFRDLDLPVSSIWLSCNPHPGAIQFLIANPQYINWAWISANPSAMELIQTNPDKVNINTLNSNPNAIDMITSSNVNWYWFGKNPALFKSSFVTEDLLLTNITNLTENKSLEAHKFMLRHKKFIMYTDFVAYNPFAFKHVLQHEPSMCSRLSSVILSENPEAIDFITATPEKIYWPKFCKNPAAIPYIKCNTDKITPSIWKNPGIFELDYQAMSIQRTGILLEELMTKTLHPSRIEYWLMNGMDMDDL